MPISHSPKHPTPSIADVVELKQFLAANASITEHDGEARKAAIFRNMLATVEALAERTDLVA